MRYCCYGAPLIGNAVIQQRFLKMKKYFMLYFLLLISIVFNSCDNSTNPVIIVDGSIEGQVTTGNFNRIPELPLNLKLYKEDINNSTLIDSAYTDSKGFYSFKNLSEGVYSICFRQDVNYTPFRDWQTNDAICNQFEVTSSDKNGIRDFHLFAWHQFVRDTILFEVDTTNWISKSLSARFYNDGVRDTLIWNFIRNNIPSWLSLDPVNGIYEPEAQSDKWLNIGINRSTFPVSMWNNNNTIMLILPIQHQFGNSNLIILFRVV